MLSEKIIVIFAEVNTSELNAAGFCRWIARTVVFLSIGFVIRLEMRELVCIGVLGATIKKRALCPLLNSYRQTGFICKWCRFSGA